MKKILCGFIAFIMASLCLICSNGCGTSKENTKIIIKDGYTELTVSKDYLGNTVYGIGCELDPHFFYANVGRSGTTDENSWACKEEDWENIFVPRIKSMNLSRIRVMLLPGWFAPDKSSYTMKNFKWDSEEMKSLYRVLDTAQECNMDVNITLWGADVTWLKDGSGWVDLPNDNEAFCVLFAEAINYLRNTKNYTCVNEVTPFNEPNALYGALGVVKGKKAYVDLCKLLHTTFQDYEIRDEVKFNLSDDARDSSWLSNTLYELEGIYDVVNSHTYDFNADDTNQSIIYERDYKLSNYTEELEQFGVPHIFGEFGLKNYGETSHTCADRATSERGLQIARVALNMFQAGSSGFSYWVLFSQYYGKTDTQMMEMGLWGFADENYALRPVYYSYSLFTRFALKNSKIYRIPTVDPNIVAIALESSEGWTYMVVNDSKTESKNIAFSNYVSDVSAFDKYTYDQNVLNTGDKVESDGIVLTDKKVCYDIVKPLTFTVYTTIKN